MNLAVHGYSEFLVVDQWNNVVCGRQTIHLKAASSIFEAAKSNDPLHQEKMTHLFRFRLEKST